MRRVIFLDFDGCVRVPEEMQNDAWGLGNWNCDFRREKFQIVIDALELTGAQLVISSDWKDLGKDFVVEILAKNGIDSYLHPDWSTPRLNQDGLFRWNEVRQWITMNPETEGYSIIEDLPEHFQGCPDEMAKRIVWCNNRHGLQPQHFGEIVEKTRL